MPLVVRLFEQVFCSFEFDHRAPLLLPLSAFVPQNPKSRGVCHPSAAAAAMMLKQVDSLKIFSSTHSPSFPFPVPGKPHPQFLHI